MGGGGWQIDPLYMDKALSPSIFIKTSKKILLVKAGINRHFLRLLASFLGMILITIGGAPFFGRRIIKKNH